MRWRYQEEVEAAPSQASTTRSGSGDGLASIGGRGGSGNRLACARDSCAFIVMGTRGQSGVVRLLMGSVAEQVVRTDPAL